GLPSGCPESESPSWPFSDGKKMPFCSWPTWAKKFSGAVTPLTPGTSGTLVEKLPGFEVKRNPDALRADQVTVAWFSLNCPAKPFAASLTSTRRVTGPFQTTSKETVASTAAVCHWGPSETFPARLLAA